MVEFLTRGGSCETMLRKVLLTNHNLIQVAKHKVLCIFTFVKKIQLVPQSLLFNARKKALPYFSKAGLILAIKALISFHKKCSYQ